MDLKLPVVLFDELSESVVKSTGLLDMGSGEILNVQYEDYDWKARGLPAEDQNYEFTSGLLASGDREVEFRVEVNVVAGTYSVTPSELLELKGRAARLFSTAPGKAPAAAVAAGRKLH